MKAGVSTNWKGVALLLLLSHLLAGGAVLGVFWLLARNGWDGLFGIVLSILAAGIVGGLVTLWLQYNWYILELMLVRFAQGQPVKELETNARQIMRWPLTGFFQILRQVGERINAFVQNEQLTQEYREQMLRQASEAAALEERNRIARDLHDSIKQQIFSISMSAAAAKAHWDGHSSAAHEAVEDIQQSAKEVQVEMQALLQQLRSAPLENTNLVEALQTQAQALGFRTGAQIEVEIGALPDSDCLPPGAQETIFRIVQETFANIARHARASIVRLHLYAQEGAVHVEIDDNGQGFNPETVRKGMGLANVQDRAGKLAGSVKIESAAGEGTRIYVYIPLLIPPQTMQEREQRRYETEEALAQAHWGLQLSANVLLLLSLLIAGSLIESALNAQVLLWIGLGMLVTLYGYIYGRYYSVQAALNIGREALEMLLLRNHQYNVHMWFLRLLLLLSWFLFIMEYGWQTTIGWWLVLGALLLICVAIVVQNQFIYRVLDRYYALLPEEEAQREVRQKMQRGRLRGRFWLILMVLILLNWIRRSDFGFPPTTLQGWDNYAQTFGLLAWGVILLMGYIQTRRWQRIWLARGSEKEVLHGRQN